MQSLITTYFIEVNALN